MADRDIVTRGGRLFRKGRIAKIDRKFGGFALVHTRAPAFFVVRIDPSILTLVGS